MSNNNLEKQQSNERLIDIPLFKTEQGQYLAANLGDPLIKALQEIAEKRPNDPIEYLINFLQEYINVRDHKDNGKRRPINGMSNVSQMNGVITQSGSGASSSAIPEKPNPPTVSERKPRYTSDTEPEDEDNADDDEANLSDSTTIAEDRDEHGQSMLHFACARSHGRNALISLIDESNIDITYRDELYRTARDVSIQANQSANAKEIDRYVLSLAANGEEKPFLQMLINGYDHLLDIEDDDGNSIFDVCRTRGVTDVAKFLEKVRPFEEAREQIHAAIRAGQLDIVEELTIVAIGSQLTRAKNYYGRTAMHIAVLKENEEIVEYLAENFAETIKIGDNLERTPLHYAMGVTKVEKISRILISKGAKRTAKDLKGRQPSYYFINKSDILRLQEEESEDR